MKKFYKKNNENITENVNKGLTKAFKDFNEAEDFARLKRSYTYPIYFTELIKDNYSELKFYGFGVPK